MEAKMDKIQLRMATKEDAKALLAIYRPYVEHTTITFEYEVPSEIEFERRIKETLEKYPYLVADCEGNIVGYAYASAFKSRAAYDWCVETSIYVAEKTRGLGVGQKLYGKLEELLKKQHIMNVNACIAYPNPKSIELHEKQGYQKVAHFSKCGYKLGKWVDMIWMEKCIGKHPDDPEPILKVNQIEWEF